MKVGAVIERERLEPVAVAANGARGRAGHLVLVARGQLGNRYHNPANLAGFSAVYRTVF